MTRKFTNSQSVTEKSINKLDKLGILVFTGISLTTAGLGVWQLRRYFEKINLIENNTNKLSDIPMSLPENITSENDVLAWSKENKGRQLNITGEFDYSREVLLGLRSAPAKFGSQAQGLATNPQVRGVFIFFFIFICF